MDRDALYAILFTTFLTGFGAAFYFSGTGATPATPESRTTVTYAPDDVRYRFQQEELRELKRKSRLTTSASAEPPPPAPAPVASETEEQVGEPPAEEPEIH
jgi:hypothetical protein